MHSAEHDKQPDEALAPFQPFDNKENNGASSVATGERHAPLRGALDAALGARGAAQPLEDSELSGKDRAMLDRYRAMLPVRAMLDRTDDVATPRVRATADGDQVVDVIASSAEALDGEARIERAHKKARLGGGSGAVHASVAEEDDAKEEEEEEAKCRQKVRITATGREGYVEKWSDNSGWVLVTLDENADADDPAFSLLRTRPSKLTFLDDEGNEMDYEDVRRPYEAKNIGRDARRKLVTDLKRKAAAYDDATPLSESDIKAEVPTWSKFDVTNVRNIKVRDAPVMDVSAEVFRQTGKGGPSERNAVRTWLLDLRFRREKDHKDSLKKTHHLEKGIDDLYDSETNSFRYEFREWFAGSGRFAIWAAVSKKIKEVNKPAHTNTLASADVDRPVSPTEFFHDKIFLEKLGGARSIEGLEGEETHLEPGSRVSLSNQIGFEGVAGYVHKSGLLFWSYRFYVPNCGVEHSPLFYNTKEEARDARTLAIDHYDFPLGRPDPVTAKWWPGMLKPEFYDLIRDGLAPNPRNVLRGHRYTTPDNERLWFHATPRRNLASIMAYGLNCCALEDELGSGKTHSRLAPAVWGSPIIEQCLRHMLSKDTIDRHVSNGLTTYATWHKVALIAIRMEGSGWNKVAMPNYKHSGCTFQHVAAFDGREFDLAAEDNLAAMRAWAASLQADLSSESRSS